MTLPYNEEFENYHDYHNIFSEHGSYIDPRDSSIRSIYPYLSSHDADRVLKEFRNWYNPISRYAPYNKEEAIEAIESNVDYYRTSEWLSQDNYLRLKLFYYFLKAYKSEKTKFRNDGINVVDLSITTGYTPHFEYFDSDRFYELPERYIEENEELDILKSILVQACDVDSLELVVPKTILTSKNNIYETFYNYLLMDFSVQKIPKKIFDKDEQRFIDYEVPFWIVSDRELRFKDEIESIRKLVPLQERKQYFR